MGQWSGSFQDTHHSPESVRLEALPRLVQPHRGQGCLSSQKLFRPALPGRRSVVATDLRAPLSLAEQRPAFARRSGIPRGPAAVDEPAMVHFVETTYTVKARGRGSGAQPLAACAAVNDSRRIFSKVLLDAEKHNLLVAPCGGYPRGHGRARVARWMARSTWRGSQQAREQDARDV